MWTPHAMLSNVLAPSIDRLGHNGNTKFYPGFGLACPDSASSSQISVQLAQATNQINMPLSLGNNKHQTII
jgi:hypothetical protein